jgi:polyisoprenyl-teichoic acid--peptidoglycan teichoic acid transferase
MPSRRQKHIRKRVLLTFFVFFLLIIGFGIVKVAKFLPSFFQYFIQKEINLKETRDKKINILLLGTGGEGHDGPNLTDTIMLANIDPNTKKATLISIPRDLWVPDLKQKINYAYASGEDVSKGSGLVLAKAAVKKVTGQSIDYAVRLDFNGFTKAVDMIGGLDITVANTFDDYQYPIEGKENDTCGHNDEEIVDLSAQIATASADELEVFPCRYKHLHFDKGLTHMDGVTALTFVRSRHGTNPEGSDFARSKRQEKVISAFKEKVFSLNTFLNPVKIVGLINTLKDSIDTDIKQDEYDDFVKLAQKMQKANVTSVSLDMGDEASGRYGILENPSPDESYNHQWVLIPRLGNGNFSEIQEYISCEIKTGNCGVGKTGITTPTPVVTISEPKK